MGSVIALSDVNSVIVERYSYDVFGKPSNTSDVNNPYLFTGRRYDDETGLYYYRARYYDYANRSLTKESREKNFTGIIIMLLLSIIGSMVL